ncbi:glutaminyl-peptide cyclotransferase-like [Oncorhynchus masou masou]|uniref:glutaminyl-peptide cyclotransferase-like n=1 Tax=Oncorhynchus masou masou TaxID=90313 RepID=UPI003183A691
MHLFYVVGICATFVDNINGEKAHIPWTQEKIGHKPSTLSSSDITRVFSHTDLNQMWQRDLRPLRVSWYPNSAGSLAVHQHIKSTLGSLRAGWDVKEDTFESHPPYGPMTFNNIIATLNPSAKRRLVLACHYDSKYYPLQCHGCEFLGATDSSVHCAMMLELVQTLDRELKILKESNPNLSLQLLFFDGEEALFQWTAPDSLYGSSQLRRWRTQHTHLEPQTPTKCIT